MPLDSSKPKWNMYKLQNNPEFDLYENVVVEYNDIVGLEVAYYELDIIDPTVDDFKGKHPMSAYKEPKSTKVSYTPGDEDKIIESFGMTADDIITYLYIPVYTFTRDINFDGEPKPGDVLKASWNGNSYQIVDVTSEDHVFQFSKLVYELKCRPYRVQAQEEEEIIEDGEDLDQFHTYETDYEEFYN